MFVFYFSSLFDVSDMLRLGIARETVASILLEIAECTTVFGFGSLDERLYTATLDIRKWCKDHNLASSIIDDISAAKLKYTSSNDYPVLSGLQLLSTLCIW